MKTAHKIIISTLILFVLANCKSEICDLPKSDFVEKLPKVGINRNVFIKIENNHIYSNEIEIHDLKDLKYNFHRYTSLNDGSNRFTYIIQASKDTKCNSIDSLLHQFAKWSMYRVFLQTNNINDSVGIRINIISMAFNKDEVADTIDLSCNSITIDKSEVVLNNQNYAMDLIQEKLLEKVKKDECFIVNISELDNYQDLILILSKYNLALYKYRQTVAMYNYNIDYNDLGWPRSDIDNEIKNKLIIK